MSLAGKRVGHLPEASHRASNPNLASSLSGVHIVNANNPHRAAPHLL